MVLRVPKFENANSCMETLYGGILTMLEAQCSANQGPKYPNAHLNFKQGTFMFFT